MELIRQSHKGNLLRNLKTGFLEWWSDGSRVMEFLETDEDSAVKTFGYMCGENWEPMGELGSCGE